ncbi:MAG: helix-turn-helix domain-containing protein [Actinomycetota bacterium]|nr:helix-turn-helix domain-containing protein [Actinomycetota bacterium]
MSSTGAEPPSEVEPGTQAGPDRSVARLRVVAHPVRLDMLSLLTGASLSATEVARELRITQANASYHLRRLLDAGLLVVDGQVKVNGGTAKKYRHPWEELLAQEGSASRAHPSDVPEADRVAQVTTLAQAVPRRFVRRVPGDTSGHFTDIDTWVDPEVWAQAVALVAEASRLMHAHACAPRALGTVRASLSVAAFRLEDQR